MTVHEGVELRHGDRLVATAKPGEITVTVPEVPDPAGAGAALWEEVHPYPTCFGCGPRRERGDALRHMCGPLAGDVVACPACTEPALPHEDGALRPEIVWAGLDCPSAAAVIPVGAPPHVLGTFTVRIDRPVAVGAPHHVIAWPIGAEGRKKWAASALLDASHRVCAVAEALWIEIRQ
jgi:hypothetical protein